MTKVLIAYETAETQNAAHSRCNHTTEVVVYSIHNNLGSTQQPSQSAQRHLALRPIRALPALGGAAAGSGMLSAAVHRRTLRVQCGALSHPRVQLLQHLVRVHHHQRGGVGHDGGHGALRGAFPWRCHVAERVLDAPSQRELQKAHLAGEGGGRGWRNDSARRSSCGVCGESRTAKNLIEIK